MKKKLLNILEYPKCNLCGSKKYNVVYDNMTYWEYPGVFREVACAECGLVFLHPRPKLQFIGRYYESDNYFGRDISAQDTRENDGEIRNTAYGPAYDAIFSKKKKGSILDIGAGTGLFLSLFKEKGWKIDGIELTPDAVAYAKKAYGVKLRQGDFFDFSFPEESFDVVTLNGALEHMYDPYGTLLQARKYLKKNGMVVFSVPNVASLGRALFGRNWFPWQPPRHLYHLSPTTARKILEKAGFRDIHVNTNYYVQNRYILFQSLRYSKSPKFQKSKKGGLADASLVNTQTSSLPVTIGKAIWGSLSEGIARVEPIFGKGEVMLVYAVNR